MPAESANGRFAHKRHAQRAQAGCQGGCQQYRGGIHTGGAEYARVYGKDVRHGHKGSDTGHDLGLDCGFVFSSLKTRSNIE